MAARSSPALGLLLALGCGFDASGEPTSAGSGVGSASESESSSLATGTSTTAASAEGTPSTGIPADTSSGPIDPTTEDSDATSSPITMTDPTADPTTDPMTDPTGGSDHGESSSGSPDAICGNGMIEAGEECETGDFGSHTCADLGAGYGGEPSCAGCHIDNGPCCYVSGVICVPGANDCCAGCGLDFTCD